MEKDTKENGSWIYNDTRGVQQISYFENPHVIIGV